MLAQYHAARAHGPGQHEDEAEPPRGIEIEDEGQGHKGAEEATDIRRVGADLPPDVVDGTIWMQRAATTIDPMNAGM